MAMNTIFMVGDRVYFPYFGLGTVTTVCDRGGHPVKVTWGNGYVTSFTAEGFLDYGDENDRLTVVEEASLKGKKEMKDEEEGTVEEDKVKTDATNPSHYRVEGIPEAIEIMKHLMTKEQLEGFLWGNILKYAYRYGRKGDKKETTGKIEWYAKHLKDIDAEGEQK